MSDLWYYAMSGQQKGPVSTEDLRERIKSGEVAASDLAWKEGMGEWQAVSKLSVLHYQAAQGIESPPPQDVAPMPAPVAPLAYGGYEPNPAAPLLSYGRDVQYGGFWIRVGAYILDAMILWIPNRILQYIIDHTVGTTFSSPGSMALIGVSFLPLMVDWLYFALMESSDKKGTLGKMICGLVVTDEHGQRITFGRATGRYFAKALSFAICFIGVIMVGGDARKQGMHDKLAKTYVVRTASLLPVPTSPRLT